MKIALIDTGISKAEINNMREIRHFSLFEEKLIEKYKEPVNSHGTDCFKEIVANAKKVKPQVLDFNIMDEVGNIQVSDMISAIKKSIEEAVDIINISLGLIAFSQELYDICKKAVQNNIVILSAASHANTVSFPADFKNVICVKVDQKQTEKIKAIDGMTVSICMKEFILSENGNIFDFSSSSMACARVCGCFCDDLSDTPLNDKFKILFRKYGIKLNRSDEICSNNELHENGIQNVILNNQVAVVLFPLNAFKSLDKNYIHKNIVAYYDHEKRGFYSFLDGKETANFNVIIMLNSASIDLEVPGTIREKYKGHKVICLGNFSKSDDNDYLLDYAAYESSEIAVLEKPVIAIASLCSGLNKSDVQLSLLHHFKQDGYKVESVSNNPIGTLYGANVFNFPEELKFPNIVYSINKFMYSSEVNKDMDAWLVNIGGSLSQVNMLNNYNFGKLADAYFLAANIDLVVLCINPSIDVQYLQLQMAYLYKFGVKKIFIVLSHNDINALTLDYRDGLQTYCIDNEKYIDSYKYFQKNIKETVLLVDDLLNGRLYQDILETLS